MDIDLDTRTQEILLAASNHDLATLKPFLRIPGAASVQDEDTGCTPLHAAIEACGSVTSAENKDERGEGEEGGEEEEADMVKAVTVVKELFLSGAIWNDLDTKGETPGCLAWRLGRKELYGLCVEAGVRAEMLLGLMGGWERLSDGSDEDNEDEEDRDIDANAEQKDGEGGEERVKDEQKENEGDANETADSLHAESNGKDVETEPKKDVNSADYLASTLTFTTTTLLDSDSNGVMMAWETSIMERTVSLLAPTPGLRILNIGFGLGIIDKLFADTKPSAHHIIEAHPDVLSHLDSLPSNELFSTKPDSSWLKENGGNGTLHGGKWQDILPSLIEAGETFDAIYFDTFGESYTELKTFFSEYVIALLEPEGKWGFFNGLGADRRVCYDVYTKVFELDACDAGFDVEWVDVPVEELGAEGEGEWKGVRRRYWVLDVYRLPVCGFMG